MRRDACRFGDIACVVALVVNGALAQTTTRVSVDSNGFQANADSDTSSISGDGRYVAFTSSASDLVPGDSNGSFDVFVRDLLSGTTTRVSVDSGGGQGNGWSFGQSISADGRYVAFLSTASNLVPGDTNGCTDVFVHDRVGGSTWRVSVDSHGRQANNGVGAFFTSISSDGRYVAFDSLATNLVPGDTNGHTDVFVHDRSSGVTTRASVNSGGVQSSLDCFAPSISGDGRLVAFYSSADNLVSGDTNGSEDVFVHDLQSGVTTRVSVDSAGAQSNGGSASPSLSSDGRFVTFGSDASNLVPGDTNGITDIFVHDLRSGATLRASVDSAGVEANAGSGLSTLSADGRFVAFQSEATNLVSGGTSNQGWAHVYLHDLLSGETSLMSVDSNGIEGNALSSNAVIAADGRYVAFWSFATNLVPGDTNLHMDVFLRDRGVASAFTPLCFGDGTSSACPCGNSGLAGHGCENSSTTGGALLAAGGAASLSTDSVQLTCSGELTSAISIVMQGSASTAQAHYGDGLRCAGGALKRLYVGSATGGAFVAPQAGDPPVSTQSAAKGDILPLGATRVYQVYYRDASATFCPAPAGGAFNVSNAIAIAWGA